jgi:hypothetical protein
MADRCPSRGEASGWKRDFVNFGRKQKTGEGGLGKGDRFMSGLAVATSGGLAMGRSHFLATRLPSLNVFQIILERD